MGRVFRPFIVVARPYGSSVTFEEQLLMIDEVQIEIDIDRVTRLFFWLRGWFVIPNMVFGGHVWKLNDYPTELMIAHYLLTRASFGFRGKRFFLTELPA